MNGEAFVGVPKYNLDIPKSKQGHHEKLDPAIDEYETALSRGIKVLSNAQLSSGLNPACRPSDELQTHAVESPGVIYRFGHTK